MKSSESPQPRGEKRMKAKNISCQRGMHFKVMNFVSPPHLLPISRFFFISSPNSSFIAQFCLQKIRLDCACMEYTVYFSFQNQLFSYIKEHSFPLDPVYLAEKDYPPRQKSNSGIKTHPRDLSLSLFLSGRKLLVSEEREKREGRLWTHSRPIFTLFAVRRAPMRFPAFQNSLLCFSITFT